MDPYLLNAAQYQVIHDAPCRPGPSRPLALLGVALAWLVLSAVGAALAASLITFASARFGWSVTGRPMVDAALLGLPLQQGLMALGAVRRGRRIGVGDLRAGLGWAPVRQRRLVTGLVGGTLLLVAAQVGLAVWLPEVHRFLSKAAPSLGGPQTGGGYAAWIVAVLVIGAPVAEEVFFRGWLWVGLRRHWGAWRTGLATGLMFLSVHWIGSDWRRLVVLLPFVVLLSVAREIGGSVRASLAVHMANNGLGAAALILARLAG